MSLPAVPAESTPWWHTRAMWLVVGGPLAVVVAATATAVIAWRGADPVVDDVPPIVVRPDAETPAMQARNHAATARAASDAGSPK